jgi:hypothetical protein
MIAIPAIAVTASFITLGLALHGREPPLPENFNWEGASLDRDFERVAEAARIAVRTTLQVAGRDGHCTARFAANAPAPDVLLVQLTHATNPALDRQWALRPSADGYAGACGASPAGHWYVTVTEPSGKWRLRREIVGPLDDVLMAAQSEPTAVEGA